MFYFYSNEINAHIIIKRLYRNKSSIRTVYVHNVQYIFTNTYQQTKIKFVFVLFLVFFRVRLLSVLRDHSFFSSPPCQWPPTSKDFYTRSYPLHYFLILLLEKEPVFPFWMFSAKQGNYWYHFYNFFGMTRSLTGDWTRDLPHSKPALYH